MKKSFYIIAAASLLVACDPVMDDGSFSDTNFTAETLLKKAEFKQYEDYECTIPSETGNYIAYSIPGVSAVSFYFYQKNGNEKLIKKAQSSGGVLYWLPSRGSDLEQTLIIETMNSDGSIVRAEQKLNVACAAALSNENKLICSNTGYKDWKWDTSGACWGNFAYMVDNGENFVNDRAGQWWGVALPEYLVYCPNDSSSQLNHSGIDAAKYQDADGKAIEAECQKYATGEESVDAYMRFNEDGTTAVYAADGSEIRTGSFKITDWTPERINQSLYGNDTPWHLGNLVTSEGAILFPYAINKGGLMPTSFEILQLSLDQLVLVYRADDVQPGAWSEATYWRFTSNSDAEGSLTHATDAESTGKAGWTWDTTGACWGNFAYMVDNGENFVNNRAGQWWGVTLPEYLVYCPNDTSSQLNHSGVDAAKYQDANGKAIESECQKYAAGDESVDARMVFTEDGTIQRYAGDGTLISEKEFKLNYSATRLDQELWGAATPWNYGTMTTDEGAILFPYAINKGGMMPTEFEILELNANKMVLIYRAEDVTPGAWSEATYWRFMWADK